MSKPFINSAKMGLLGGISEWAKVMEKYNAIRMQNEDRAKLVQQKSDALERMNAMRAQATKAARLAAAEANQKIEYTHHQKEDGTWEKVGTKWHIDPDNPDGPHVTTEVDRVPVQPIKPVNKQIHTLHEGDNLVDVLLSPDTGEATELSRGKAGGNAAAQAAAAAQRLKYREGSLNARTAQMENNRRDDLIQKSVQRAGEAWRDPTMRKAMLEETGVDPTDPKARQKVLDAIETQAKAKLPHIDVPEAPSMDSNTMNPGDAQQPQPPSTVKDQNGKPRPVRYDAQGQAYIKDKDGKPQPVKVNPQGVAIDAPPLALDTMGTDAGSMAQAGGDNYDEEDAQAGNDDEQMLSDDEDDDEEPPVRQGLTGYG